VLAALEAFYTGQAGCVQMPAVKTPKGFKILKRNKALRMLQIKTNITVEQ
jgi:hypothetical protein